MKFNELCKSTKFRCIPTLYFLPKEHDKVKGDYPFILQFINEEIKEKLRYKKRYWTMVIDLLQDKRTDTTTSPIRPGRYLFDLSEENMGKLDLLQSRGVDIFSRPIEFVHRLHYKGDHLYTYYDFQALTDEASPGPSAPKQGLMVEPSAEELTETWFPDEKPKPVPKPKPSVKTIASDDDFDFNFDECPE